MYNISHTYKRTLFALLKLVIVVAAFYYIYKQLTGTNLLSISQLKEQGSTLLSTNIWILLIVCFFTDANWILEILKWKNLALTENKITFIEASKQCLAALTVSIITPNRIGEYGAKALFYSKEKRKKIMFLNLIGNLSQLGITVLFGMLGLVFFTLNFKHEIPPINFYNLLLLLCLSYILFLFRKKLKLQKVKCYLKQLPKSTYSKTLALSLFRYLIFSHQFYFLLVLFNIETDYYTLINLIFCMYLIASIIPSLSIFDWVIKGSVAVWFFSFIGINALTIITISTFMWILNFAIPAVLGSIFVLNFKLIEQK